MTLFERFRDKWRQINWLVRETERLHVKLDRVQLALGRIETRQLEAPSSPQWDSFNFPVFSQWGEDGLLQFLVQRLPIARKVFVEFGVQNYQESNSRFLLANNHWAGLVIEANSEDVSAIKQDALYWQFNLKAVHSFVTRENINELFQSNGINGEIGLLSIDIDGNDYWVWEAITSIQPAIVIVEYNHRFGPRRSVAVPYRPDFSRGQAHPSMIYYGASLAALTRLASKKGYALVGCTRAGNDAFFVRRDLLNGSVKEVSVDQGFVAGQFRESRDEEGHLLFLSPEEEAAILKDLPLVEIL